MKLLFLPHCLKPEFLKILKEEGKKKGYEVFVVPGSSRVKKILSNYKQIDKIIGVACDDEIKLALEYTGKLVKKGTVVKLINLLKDGCKDTEVDLKKVLQEL